MFYKEKELASIKEQTFQKTCIIKIQENSVIKIVDGIHQRRYMNGK